MRKVFALPFWFSVSVGLAACGTVLHSTPESVAQRLQNLPVFEFLLLGEQHDNPDHQNTERLVLENLAGRKALGGLAVEMADAGQSTHGLPANATEAEVQKALQWNDKAWPWKAYGPVVMVAVRNGAPVLGANLPRNRMREAMTQAALDGHLNPEALKEQQDAIRDGHCNALTASQIAPIARIQIARDRAMAQTLEAASRGSTGQVLVLIAGHGHVNKALGVPRHWQNAPVKYQSIQLQGRRAGETLHPDAAFDAIWLTAAIPEKDYCAEFKAISR